MIQRLCPRCHSVLHLEDENTLIFCWSCGAPQVTLSEELQEQAAAQLLQPAEDRSNGAGVPDHRDGASPATATDAEATEIVWRTLLLLCLAVAAALSVLDLLLPPLALLAPVIVLAIYAARFRYAVITAGLGARVGAVCGVFTAAGVSVLLAGGELLSRLTTHRMAPAGSAILERVRLQTIAQQGAAAAELFDQFSNPEMRVGWFLSILAVCIVFLLVLSTAGGAFAGFVRSRSRPRASQF